MGTSTILTKPSPAGILALKEATADMIRKRIRRWFERNTVIGFDNWVLNGKPAFTGDDALAVLDSLNSDHDQEIINLVDCLRQIEQTYSDLGLSWYVDTVNGSDATGDGSATAPFATVTKVQSFYGQNAYINGNVNIFVTAPTTAKLLAISDWKILFGPLGQLTIQGMDAQRVIGGPFTIAGGGWADLGVAATMGHSITLTAAALVPHAHKGQFIRVLTGAGNRVGNFYCIHDNTDTIVYIARTTAPLAAGNTFEIVMPGTVIEPLSATIDIDIEGLQAYEITYADRFIMTNIQFRGGLQIHSLYCGVTLGLCYIEAGTTKWLNCSSMFFQLCAPMDGAQIVNPKQILGDCPLVWFQSLWTEVFSWVNARRLTFGSLTHASASGQLSIQWSAGNNIADFSGALWLDTCLLGPVGNDHFTYIKEIKLTNIYTLGCDDFINQVLSDGWIEISNVEGVAPTGYTIRAGALCKIICGVASVIGGAVNDVYWSYTATPAAFPVAGSSITDGNGAYLLG